MGLIKTYSELITLKTIEERFEYLKLTGRVCESTFGFDRYLNQALYTSDDWRSFRRQIIIRDGGWDLGVYGYPIGRYINVHHINPLSIKAIESMSDEIFDPENVICSSDLTHKAIHYGDASLLPQIPVERRPWDTCPWRR